MRLSACDIAGTVQTANPGLRVVIGLSGHRLRHALAATALRGNGALRGHPRAPPVAGAAAFRPGLLRRAQTGANQGSAGGTGSNNNPTCAPMQAASASCAARITALAAAQEAKLSRP